MIALKTVVVGMIGSGFASRLHCEAYRCVYGADVRLKTVASIAPDLQDFAKEFGFEYACADYKKMLDDPEIDVVDIITPPALHRRCILDVAAAGKHIICEKPLTGYFGQESDEKPVGLHVSREKMKRAVMAELKEIRQAVEDSGKLFMYAENWVYAPSVQKAAEFIRSTKQKNFFLKAEESHSGSHAAHAAHWGENGGGSLIRQGSHPISTVLYLKKVEADARGEDVYVTDITAETAVMASHFSNQDTRHIDSRPVDVEDWASATIAFSDGSKAVVISGDMVLGGAVNYVEVFGSEGVLQCRISPNNAMETYFVDETRLGGIYITEKVQNKSGWQKIFLNEHINRGYTGELQDFVECVVTGRKPVSDLDLAESTMEVIYGAYLSATEGKRVSLRRGGKYD